MTGPTDTPTDRETRPGSRRPLTTVNRPEQHHAPHQPPETAPDTSTASTSRPLSPELREVQRAAAPPSAAVALAGRDAGLPTPVPARPAALAGQSPCRGYRRK